MKHLLQDILFLGFNYLYVHVLLVSKPPLNLEQPLLMFLDPCEPAPYVCVGVLEQALFILLVLPTSWSGGGLHGNKSVKVQ